MEAKPEKPRKAKPRKANRIDHLAERTKLGLNQSQYWNPLGVTQSSGSRYESRISDPSEAVEKLAILRKQGVAIPELA